MKILVLSDSHGMTDMIEEIFLLEQPDAALHLGDYASDLDELKKSRPGGEMYAVRGNCDWRAAAPGRLIKELDGLKLLMVHGHMQQVKTGLERLYFTALEAGADAALFGHTHLPFLQSENGLTLLNPGAAMDGCYALIEDGRFSLKRL